MKYNESNPYPQSVTNPSATNDELDEILVKLSAEVGEEYYKLHSGKQDFDLTNSRMKYYEVKAKQAIAAYVPQAERKAVIVELKKHIHPHTIWYSDLGSIRDTQTVAERISELERQSDG